MKGDKLLHAVMFTPKSSSSRAPQVGHLKCQLQSNFGPTKLEGGKRSTRRKKGRQATTRNWTVVDGRKLDTIHLSWPHLLLILPFIRAFRQLQIQICEFENIFNHCFQFGICHWFLFLLLVDVMYRCVGCAFDPWSVWSASNYQRDLPPMETF